MVTVGALVHFVQCNVYDPALLDPDPSRPRAGSGVGFWSGRGDRGCYSAGMPTVSDRPSAASNLQPVPPIVLAVSSMRLGSTNLEGELDPDAWKTIGFDLDGRCTGSDTCPGTDSPPSCRPPVSEIPTDGEACRDNTFGKLEYTVARVPEVARTYGLNDDTFNCALCTGRYNFLIRISDYDGTPSDDRVRVDFYPSPGLEEPLRWSCETEEWRSHPCFTSDDPFTVQSDPLEGDDVTGAGLRDSFISDANAFVRDGVLIAQIPQNTQIWFPARTAGQPTYPLRFQQASVVGHLELASDNVWRLNDGIIAGRARGEDIIEGFRLIGFCEGDDIYTTMRDLVRRNLDVLSSGSDRDATCDAMSVGLGFTARQATAGKVVSVPPLQECVRAALPDADASASGTRTTDGDAGAHDAGR